MQQSLQQFDVGATIAVALAQPGGAAFDLDGTEQVWMLLETPSGRTKKLDASVDAEAETVERVTESLDLDEFGTWRVQALVQRTGLFARSAVVLLEVRPNLDTPSILLLPGLAEGRAQPLATALSGGESTAPLDTLAGDELMRDLSILTAWSDYSGGDKVSSDADTSWLELAVAALPYPAMRNVGLVRWEVACLYYKTGIGAQVLEWELVVDGVPTGAAVTFSSSATVNLPGLVLLTAELRVVHDTAGDTLYDLTYREQVRDDAGATVLDEQKSARPAIDSLSDHEVCLRVRKTAIVGDAILVRSVGCTHPLRPSRI